MNIGIVGAGGVGGLLAGLLLAEGHSVYLSARGEHAAAISGDGLKVQVRGRSIDVRPTAVLTTDLSQFSKCEVILLTVKMYDLESTCQSLQSILNSETALVTFQNGVEAPSVVSRYFGEKNSVGGSIITSARIERPGLIVHEGANLKVSLENKDSRIRNLAEAMSKAGIETLVSDDFSAILWKKLIRLASVSGVTCLTRQPYGWIKTNPEANNFLRELICEAYKVAVACGEKLPNTLIEESYEGLNSHSLYNFKPSMLLDLEKGKKLEVKFLSGAVSRLGREKKIATPCSDAVVVALAPYEKGNSHTLLT